jgi:ubiquinol-cytochrome c reductase cytochrome b subunit
VLFAAGGNDVLAARFDISVNLITWVFRIFLLALPPLTGLLTYRLCKELQAHDRATPRPMTVLERTEAGGYVEVEEPAGAPRI